MEKKTCDREGFLVQVGSCKVVELFGFPQRGIDVGAGSRSFRLGRRGVWLPLDGGPRESGSGGSGALRRSAGVGSVAPDEVPDGKHGGGFMITYAIGIQKESMITALEDVDFTQNATTWPSFERNNCGLLTVVRRSTSNGVGIT